MLYHDTNVCVTKSRQLFLQAKEKRQAKEAQVSKAQMDAARRGGVSWGMADDAALEEDLDNVTEGGLVPEVHLACCPFAFLSFPCHHHLCCAVVVL